MSLLIFPKTGIVPFISVTANYTDFLKIFGTRKFMNDYILNCEYNFYFDVEHNKIINLNSF